MGSFNFVTIRYRRHTPLFILAFFLANSRALAQEPSGNNDKAVFETSKEQGFKVQKKALENIEVKLAEVKTQQIHSVPTECLVLYQSQVGVYRFRNGWFKLITVQILKKGASLTSIRSSELNPGDSLVIEGAALMRVAEMDAFGGEGQ